MQTKADLLTLDLFDQDPDNLTAIIPLAEGACILRNAALPVAEQLLEDIRLIVAQAPLKQMITPGGRQMSVLTTSCGRYGWHSDHAGYRYTEVNPATQMPWPAITPTMFELAAFAAASAGFADFVPDCCLINCYKADAKLSLHQDKDENDQTSPIVSVSLGLPAVFLFGGLKRDVRPTRHRLLHGDVAVWGGPARMAYHGIEPLMAGIHPLTRRVRFNLTFRKVD